MKPWVQAVYYITLWVGSWKMWKSCVLRQVDMTLKWYLRTRVKFGSSQEDINLGRRLYFLCNYIMEVIVNLYLLCFMRCVRTLLIDVYFYHFFIYWCSLNGTAISHLAFTCLNMQSYIKGCCWCPFLFDGKFRVMM